MAETLTWQQKLEQGIPLNELERVKEAAHRITLRRIRDAEEDAARAAERAGALAPAQKETSPKDSKKGN